jgi:hypothetical protein
LGGLITIKGGLAPAPFFYCPFPKTQTLVPGPGAVVVSTRLAAQKSERPVGVPAALAWGMEGLHLGSSILLGTGRSFNCARQQQNNTQEQDRYDHSAHSRSRTELPTAMCIVPFRPVQVTRLKGSIATVLPTGTSVLAYSVHRRRRRDARQNVSAITGQLAGAYVILLKLCMTWAISVTIWMNSR